LKTIGKYLLTGIVVAIAVALVLQKYWDYVVNPWTRDGQIRAEVIQITPRVSGPIVSLPVVDNQLVKKGDVLFEIDPRTFRASLAQAQAQLQKAKNNYDALEKQVEAAEAQVKVAQGSVLQADSSIKQLESEIAKNEAEYQRQQELLPQQATSQKAVERARANYEVSVQQRNGAMAGLLQARASLIGVEADLAEAKANLGAPGQDNASIRVAQADLEQAQLNLGFTRVVAPVDGYVTNLNLRMGSQAVANQPALAFVDINSFWVHGFFRENSIAPIKKGHRAIVTLMSYPDKPIEGSVDSLAWGIAQQDDSPGFEMLPNVSPTFEWIRLAQRVPVRIHLGELPEGVALRVGTTASVLVMTGSASGDEGRPVPPAPSLLQ